jgi:GNAT superfamily N-acetyltransferase
MVCMTQPAWRIAPLTTEYVHSLAECHIACWREAYRGLVPDHILDAFEVERRAEQWERIRVRNPGSVYVALVDDEVIGFSCASPSRDESPVTPTELNALYVRAAWYGTGVAHDLIRAAVPPDIPCSLWVFEKNPRAQTFYRKHGFELDGTSRIEAFTPAVEVRMVRR